MSRDGLKLEPGSCECDHPVHDFSCRIPFRADQLGLNLVCLFEHLLEPLQLFDMSGSCVIIAVDKCDEALPGMMEYTGMSNPPDKSDLLEMT